MTELTVNLHPAAPEHDLLPDEAEEAAAAFLTRYQGRTLEA